VAVWRAGAETRGGESMYKKSSKEKALVVGEVLLLGCEGAGKTLLCRHLQKLGSNDANAKLQTNTQPSIGVETLEVPHASRSIEFREVGGTMQPVWNSYFEGCSAIVLVADSSKSHAAVSAAVELAEVLRSPTASNKRVLLLLNKRDAVGALPEGSLRQLIGLPAMEAAAGDRLSVQLASALSGDGLLQLLDWCYQSCVDHSKAASLEAAAAKAAAKAASKAASKAQSQMRRANASAEGLKPSSRWQRLTRGSRTNSIEKSKQVDDKGS